MDTKIFGDIFVLIPEDFHENSFLIKYEIFGENVKKPIIGNLKVNIDEINEQN